MPREPLDVTAMGLEDHSELLRCSICLEIFTDPVFCGGKPCQHTFCRACLNRSYLHTSQCPVCRQNIKKEDIQPHHVLQGLLDPMKIKKKVEVRHPAGAQSVPMPQMGGPPSFLAAAAERFKRPMTPVPKGVHWIGGTPRTVVHQTLGSSPSSSSLLVSSSPSSLISRMVSAPAPVLVQDQTQETRMRQMIQLLEAQRSRTEQLERDKTQLQDMLDRSGGSEDTMGRQKTELNQARREVEKAVMRISELTADLETRDARFQQRLDSEHQNTEAINATLAAAHREAGTAWSRNSELTSERESRERRISELMAELEKMKARNDKLEGNQQNHQQNVQDMLGVQQKGLAAAVREIERARMNISALTLGMSPGPSPVASPIKEQRLLKSPQAVVTPPLQTHPLFAEDPRSPAGSPKAAEAVDLVAMELRDEPRRRLLGGGTGGCCWMQ